MNHQLGRVGVAVVVGATLLTFGCAGSSPSPSPLSSTQPAASASAARSGPQAGWSFESGLSGWTLESGATQPACDVVLADRLRTREGKPPVTLSPSGDYWRTPIDVGAEGRCRIDTELAPRRKTRLASPELVLRTPYLAFRVGGGGRAGTSIALEAKEHSEAPLLVEHGPGTLAMHEVVWDVRAWQGKPVRLTLVDDAAAATGILLDAVRELEQLPEPRPAPIWGFADLHAHAMSEFAFGRHLFYGSADGPIAQSLGPCDGLHGKGGGGVLGRSWPLMGFFEQSYTGAPGHATTGAPKFDGWPRWTTQAHQQMHVDWIRRAWQGGLRLLVTHAVNNEELASEFGGEKSFDDQTVAIAQLDQMVALAQRHPDFMAVARSPGEAREIIESGRLAVVLGVEVDAIGQCRRDDDCDQAKVRAAIDELYAHGARHVFPIHLADNAFGGSAIYRSLFVQLSWFLRDEWPRVDHDDSLDFSLKDAPQGLPEWFAHLPVLANYYHHLSLFPAYSDVAPGHVNRRGLTELGKFAVRTLIDKGVLIDVDHMSEKARRDTFAIAAARAVPVVMGHSWFRDLGYGREQSSDPEKFKNEAMKTGSEIEALRALGGVVAPITNQGDVLRVQDSGVATECAGASSSWLQAYSYAVVRMGGAGVGFGTDFNGLAQEPLPRFGPAACLARAKHTGLPDARRQSPGRTMSQTVRDDAETQDAGVTYATPLVDAHKFRFLVASPSKGYDAASVTLWVALAVAETKQDPSKLGLAPGEAAVVQDVAAGLSDNEPSSTNSWRAAAFLVKSGAPEPTKPGFTRDRYRKFLPIHRQWQRMKSGNATAPLERNLAGDRDFDVNLDGLAHYGLLPDFLQDVSNQLRRGQGSVRDLSALFRSAESYVQSWERATQKSTPQ